VIEAGKANPKPGSSEADRPLRWLDGSSPRAARGYLGGDMSSIKDTPVIAMERLCEEKLKCWVCTWARKARGQRTNEDGD
jgi:hypothetical protein